MIDNITDSAQTTRAGTRIATFFIDTRLTAWTFSINGAFWTTIRWSANIIR